MMEKLSRYNHFFQMADTLRVVYNARTGAVVQLDKNTWEILQEGKPENLRPSVEDTLREQGMIVAAEADELSLAMEMYQQRRESRDKLMLTIAPTLDCNFACPYCYENRLPGIMDEKTADQVIDFIEDRMKLSREVSVTWYGGEPLLAAGRVLALTERIRSLSESAGKAASFFIVTNGYLLTPELASRLATAGVSGIQITLDGPPEVHDRRRVLRGGGGTFHRLLQSIRIAVDVFDVVKVRMNLDRENQGEWEKLTEILERADILGKVYFEIANVDATNEANEGYKSQCLSPETFSCEWISFALSAYRRGDTSVLKLPKMTVCTKISDWSCVITPNGETYACWNDVGQVDKITGHVSDPEMLDQGRAWARFNPLDWPECRECTLLPACMGRCPDLLEKKGPSAACGRWKHCLREAVILHTMSKLEGGNHGKSEKRPEVIGTETVCSE